jgi:hypothetical protein
MGLAASFARERGKPRAKRLQALQPREAWLADVEQATALVRERKARELDARSREVGLERRAEWRESSTVWRDKRSGRTEEHGDRVHRLQLPKTDRGRIFNDPSKRPGSPEASYVDRAWGTPTETDERLAGAPELTSQWHASRAKTKRALFERVKNCGEESQTLTLVCRNCESKIPIPTGCGSHWFCAECRATKANKFRGDFERKRLGLIATATRAGLTRRRQKKSDRFGERLLTVTLPHVGTPAERIRTLKATWLRFWRTLREHVRPTMQTRAGITLQDVPRGMSDRALAQREERAKQSLEAYNRARRASTKIGPLQWKQRIEFFPEDSGLGWQRGVELAHWDVLSYLHVLEWTPGSDGLGHPHLHVWLFSRYLEQPLIERLWRAAYAHVLEVEISEVPRLIVDIRAAGPDVGHELVKYLTKDWEINEGTARRVPPEIFAQVYAELDGKRLRQSSAGLSNWAVAKVCACPACGFKRERGHWARLDIVHALESAPRLSAPARPRPWDGTRAPLAAASQSQSLRIEYLERHSAEWETTPAAELWAAYQHEQRGPVGRGLDS